MEKIFCHTAELQAAIMEWQAVVRKCCVPETDDLTMPVKRASRLDTSVLYNRTNIQNQNTEMEQQLKMNQNIFVLKNFRDNGRDVFSLVTDSDE